MVFIGVLALLEVIAYGVPTVGKLERELGEIDLPKGTRIAHSEMSGNLICFDECTSLQTTYAVPGRITDDQVASILRKAGYDVFRDTGPQDYVGDVAYTKRHRIRWSVGESVEDVTEVELWIDYSSGA